jgi:hypothetical protein
MENKGFDVMRIEDCIFREIVNGDTMCEWIAMMMKLLNSCYSHSVGDKTAERSLTVNASEYACSSTPTPTSLLCSHLLFFGKYTQLLRSLCFSPGHPAGLTQV